MTQRAPFPRLSAWLARSLGATLLAAACTAAQAQPVHYAIDLDNTRVYWEVRHFGTSTLRGRFGAIRGNIALDTKARAGQISIEVDTSSVDTGTAPFNSILRGRDLFDVQAFPKAWFVARQLSFDGPRLRSVTGELTLHGVSTGLTLTATRFGCYMHPTRHREVCGGDFEGTLHRTDFGLGYLVPLVGNEVRLVVQVEGVRADGAQDTGS